MKKIKHVYFDVGGVALLDFSGTDKWRELKRDIGVTPDKDEAYDNLWNVLAARVCLDVDVDTLPEQFERALGLKFPKNYSMLEDFLNRFEVSFLFWHTLINIYPLSFRDNFSRISINNKRGLNIPSLIFSNAVIFD